MALVHPLLAGCGDLQLSRDWRGEAGRRLSEKIWWTDDAAHLWSQTKRGRLLVKYSPPVLRSVVFAWKPEPCLVWTNQQPGLPSPWTNLHLRDL